MTSPAQSLSICRACGGNTRELFKKILLARHSVTFQICNSCGHVQTPPPFWLEEAYNDLSFELDVGMVSRSIQTAHQTLALAYKNKIAGDRPCIDFGAGTGLFVRYCRDYGLNCYYHDRYAKNIFALGYEAPDPSQIAPVAMVTAFEVLEHLPNPSEDLKEIFAYKPDFFFCSTLLYNGEDENWWYFLPNGQHVAYYTRQSLKCLAEQFGYYVVHGDGIHLFSQKKLPQNYLQGLGKRARWQAKRYRNKHGSRTEADFQKAMKRLNNGET